jgi:hypothetical protein
MAAGYDGEEFVGIDEELVEPSGPAARFWSTHLDNAIASNVQFLSELGTQVTWTPLTDNAGDYNDKEGVRPFTSLDFTTVFLIPWIFAEDVSAVQLGLIARVADEPGDSTSVQVKWQRRSADLTATIRQSTTASLASTIGASPEFQDHKLTLATGEQLGDAVGALVMLVAGVSASSDLATTLGGGSQRTSTIYKADDTDFYLDGSLASRPDADSLDLQYTRLTGGGGNSDHVFYPQNFGSADGELIGVLGPTRPVPNQLARRAISYLQLKSATLWQTFTDVTRPDPRVYAAQKPLLGEVAVTHALRTDVVYTRPRPIWWGPVGYLPNPEASEWPTGFTYRFSRVYGDDTTTQTLINASIHLETVNPVVRILAYVAPLHIFPVPYPEGTDLTTVTPQIEWEHTVEVTQLEDGDASWASAAGRGSASEIIRHGHRPYEEGSLLCVTESAIRYPFSGDSAGQGYAYREGQISAATDLSKLELISLTVPVIYDPTTDRPLRLHWYTKTQTPLPADWGDVADGPNPFFPDTEAARDLDTLGFIVVGVTIWEIPQ